MRARVLATGKVVPVQARTAFVIARNLLDAERPALPQLRWQRDLRKIRRQRLREIDYANAPVRERHDEAAEQLRGTGHRLVRHVNPLPLRARVRGPWDCRASVPATPAPRRRDRCLR